MNRVSFEQWKLNNEDRIGECRPCVGTGSDPCSDCKGESSIKHTQCHGEGCGGCHGEGYIDCCYCDGEGVTECWHCKGDKTNARLLYEQQHQKELVLLSEWQVAL